MQFRKVFCLTAAILLSGCAFDESDQQNDPSGDPDRDVSQVWSEFEALTTDDVIWGDMVPEAVELGAATDGAMLTVNFASSADVSTPKSAFAASFFDFTDLDTQTGWETLLNGLRLPFQVVPEFPEHDRYDGQEFEPYRRAFQEQCKAAAVAYESTITTKLLSSNAAFSRSDVSALRASIDRHDLFCLNTLEGTPSAIRSITGSLYMFDENNPNALAIPFCSSTLISPIELITARHCFFKASDGAAKKSYRSAKRGSIFFIPNTAKRYSEGITIQVDHLEPLEDVPFAAQDDLVRVSLKQAAPSFSQNMSVEVQSMPTPIPVYLVGPNLSAADNDGRGPLGNIRTSAPNACAILEVTANGCAYHTCQATETASGAGLIYFDPASPDKVNVLAVHKGPIWRGPDCEAPEDFKDVRDLRLNVAALGQ